MGLLDVIGQIDAACGGLSTADKLGVITVMWVSVASNLRSDALVAPRGFPEERIRQFAVLRWMVEMVGGDEPDREVERLFQEGNIDGIWERFRKQFGDGWKVGA